MADFQTQIENITKLDASADQSKITQWLKDGIKEIINRIIAISPGETAKFTSTSNSNLNNDITVQGKILSVMRDQYFVGGNRLRKADMIDPNSRYDVTDSDSIYYRTAYNPCYYILDGKINTLPTPDNDNLLYVTQVYYEQDVAYDSTSVSNFPDEYEHLVPMYAAIKFMFRQLAVVEEEMGTMNLPEIPQKPILSENQTILDGITVPVFDMPDMSYIDWADTDKWISTEEDSEMLAARVQEIEGKTREFAVKVDGARAQFENDNSKFQADVSAAIKNTEHKDQKEIREIQIFQNEVISYEKQTVKEIQRYQYEVLGKVKAKYEWLGGRMSGLLQDYNGAFSVMGDVAARMKQQQQQPQRSRRQ